MPQSRFTIASLRHELGKELGVTDWLPIDQALITRFAECTGDHQWIHTDPERAGRESPFGTTVAHGFLVAALLPRFIEMLDLVPGDARLVVNYGVERLRFTAPVPAGARLRDRVVLRDLRPRDDGALLATTAHTVEIEDAARPAMVCDVLTLFVR